MTSNTSNEAAISIRHLYKVFGKHPDRAMTLVKDGLARDELFERTGMTLAIDDVNFDVYEGEVFVIMGLSGSGKSTLLRMVNRLIEPTTGDIHINGRSVRGLGRAELIEMRRSQMSMVFQSFALMPHLSCWKNAAFGLEVAGIAKEERRERALAALDQVGLRTHADAHPGELSGGMKQRVGLARALAVDPRLLLMDEAFSALDPLIRTEMQDQLLELQSKRPRTVLFISHDLDEAMKLGDRIAILQGGRLVQIGTPQAILREPANDFVRSFLGGVDLARVHTVAEATQTADVPQLLTDDVDVDGIAARLEVRGSSFGYLTSRTGDYRGAVTVAHRRAGVFAFAMARWRALHGVHGRGPRHDRGHEPVERDHGHAGAGLDGDAVQLAARVAHGNLVCAP